VWGGQRLFTKHHPIQLKRGVAVTVVLGEPIRPEPGEEHRQLLQRIRTAMEELVDQAQRTYPQQPAGDDDRWWLPAHLGGTAPTPETAAAEDEIRAAGKAPTAIRSTRAARVRALVGRRR
jgi:hypothetical protein